MPFGKSCFSENLPTELRLKVHCLVIVIVYHCIRYTGVTRSANNELTKIRAKLFFLVKAPGAERVTTKFLTLSLQLGEVWPIVPVLGNHSGFNPVLGGIRPYPIVFSVDCWLIARYLSTIFAQKLQTKWSKTMNCPLKRDSRHLRVLHRRENQSRNWLPCPWLPSQAM